MNPPKPFVSAFVLCRKAKRDKRTRLVDLIGVGGLFPTRTLPTIVQGDLYWCMLAGPGEYSMRYELLKSDIVLHVIPLAPVTLDREVETFEVAPFSHQIGHAGEYEIRVYANDELIVRKRFEVELSTSN